jgi:hypothetical protein
MVIIFLSQLIVFHLVKVRNELRSKELKKLKIRKWTSFVRIMEIEFGKNFGCMSEFISWNP